MPDNFTRAVDTVMVSSAPGSLTPKQRKFANALDRDIQALQQRIAHNERTIAYLMKKEELTLDQKNNLSSLQEGTEIMQARLTRALAILSDMGIGFSSSYKVGGESYTHDEVMSILLDEAMRDVWLTMKERRHRIHRAVDVLGDTNKVDGNLAQSMHAAISDAGKKGGRGEMDTLTGIVRQIRSIWTTGTSFPLDTRKGLIGFVRARS